MKKLLSLSDDILNEVGIRYWIDGGVLLGLHRFDSFLPWDDDIDLGVLGEISGSKVQQLEKAAEKRGLEFTAIWGDFETAGNGLGAGKPPMWAFTFTPTTWKQFILETDPEIPLEQADRLVLEYMLHDNVPRSELIIFEQQNDLIIPQYEGFKKMLNLGGFPLNVIFQNGDTNTQQPTHNFLGKDYPIPERIEDVLADWYKSPNIKTDIVMNAALHTGRCTQKIRFRDTDKTPHVIEYLKKYLQFVFGNS